MKTGEALERGSPQLLKILISNNVGRSQARFEHTAASARGRAPFRSRGWFARFQGLFSPIDM